jgi:hypothetical protein
MKTPIVIQAMDGNSKTRVSSPSDKRIPPPYGKVSARARLLYAITKHTTSSRLEIRKFMDLSQKDISLMWKEMRSDENAKHIIKAGLPAMYGEPMPEGCSALCTKCNRLITWVPCVSCCYHSEVFVDRGDKLRIRKGERFPPEHDAPTKFLPGSDQKIAVMRYRVDMGFQPFCTKDAIGASRV